MTRIEFNDVEHARLFASGYKVIEIITTGREVETSEDYFRKEVVLRAYKEQPLHSKHYLIEVSDDEVRDIAAGNDTDIFYIETA